MLLWKFWEGSLKKFSSYTAFTQTLLSRYTQSARAALGVTTASFALDLQRLCKLFPPRRSPLRAARAALGVTTEPAAALIMLMSSQFSSLQLKFNQCDDIFVNVTNRRECVCHLLKVRFKRLDLRFLEIGVLRVVFTKRDPEFPGISGQVV
eukprot:sb/3473464/